MMGNDQLGDCTCAAVAHAHQAWVLSQVNPGITANPIMPSTDAVVGIYEAWCGYDPNDPTTDQGGVMLNVLNRWRKEGFEGRPILAYTILNSKNSLAVKQTLSMFGCAYVGVQLPVSAQNQAVWDVVSDDGGVWGGHAIVLVDYDADGLTCITWGALQRMTWKWLSRYCDEAYAIVAQDFRKDGFDKASLMLDLAEVTA
jgi:hypothetical protein